MKKSKPNELLITGLGVTSAIAQGKASFSEALLAGKQAFGVMQRPGRQYEDSRFLGAEIASLIYPDELNKSLLRTASLSGHAALITLHEAWQDARLADVDPERIGLIIGGSNIQQRELNQIHQAYQDRTHFLRPHYGLTFMDSDLCGLCTEQFGIRGFAYMTGGASASGQLAIIQAIQAVQSGQVDVCIAMGALMDLSYWELQGFSALGAMGSDPEPAKACRPFDAQRNGFIYGESCGAIVIEKKVDRPNVKPYASLTGWGVAMDANRNPNPSYAGEMRVIQKALQQAQVFPEAIDYINPHGSGSVIGDETELRAIIDSRLAHAYINASKSILGHGLSAAGAVEVIATLAQMQASCLHPSLNLDNPIDASCNWVRQKPIAHAIDHALTLSMGFGGINTALCLKRYEA